MTLRLAIVLTVLTHVAFVSSRMTVSLYGIRLGASPLTVGVLMALYAALPMLLAVYAGRQVDRIGPRRPMLVSSVGLVAGVALPALHRRLRDGCEAEVAASAVRAEEVEGGHERRCEPSGSKSGFVVTTACSIVPSTLTSKVLPSSASSTGTTAIPIVFCNCSLQRMLVMRPDDLPSTTTWPPSTGARPFGISKPTSIHLSPRSATFSYCAPRFC